MTDVGDKDTTLKSNDASATHFRDDRLGTSPSALEMSVLVSFPDDAPDRECKLVQVKGMRAHLLASTDVEIGQALLLTNPKSLTQLACRVGYVRKRNGVFHIGLEFTADPSSFWDFTISPSDFDPIQRSSGASESTSVPLNDSLNRNGASSLMVAQPWEDHTEGAKRTIKRRSILKWTALALTGFMIVYFLFFARLHESTAESAATMRLIFQDIAPELARLIPDIGNYRLATASDFNPEASRWLANSGNRLGGEFQCAFSPSDLSRVYVLIGKDGNWRLVILSRGNLRYDAQYSAIAIVTRLSKQAVQEITWAEPHADAPEGDGLLIVRKANDIGSAVVLFSRGDQIVSGSPFDYRQIPTTQISP